MAQARRILFAVTGLTPQVITETVYALHREGPEALPTEIHALTTSEGATRLLLSLFGGDPGWFGRLLREYDLPQIRFGPEQVHILEDGRGQPMPDIRTEADNERLADRVTEMIRQFTAKSDSLHVSLAGGRKTMGYYAGYALSLFGRSQDRLSHVLVSPPFESHPEFFYPARQQRIIYDREGKPWDAGTAEVTLAGIPFVRMRGRVQGLLRRGPAGFSATVHALNRQDDAPTLTLDAAKLTVHAGDRAACLRPREFAFYWMFCRARLDDSTIRCPGVDRDYKLATSFLKAYRETCSPARVAHMQRRFFKNPDKAQQPKGMDAKFFSQARLRVNQALATASVGEACFILRLRQDDRSYLFAVTVPPEDIHIKEKPISPDGPGYEDA